MESVVAGRLFVPRVFAPSLEASHSCALADVEDAIERIASRDAVSFDPGEHKWTSSIPSKATIRTAFGEVRCGNLLLVVRETDRF